MTTSRSEIETLVVNMLDTWFWCQTNVFLKVKSFGTIFMMLRSTWRRSRTRLLVKDDFKEWDFNPSQTGGWWIPPPWREILFFNMKTCFKHHETSWHSQFQLTGAIGTIFSNFCLGAGHVRSDFVKIFEDFIRQKSRFSQFWTFMPILSTLLEHF